MWEKKSDDEALNLIGLEGKKVSLLSRLVALSAFESESESSAQNENGDVDASVGH